MSGLTKQEMKMLEGLRRVILRKVQQGKGVRAGDIINAVINFIEKLGVPVTKTTWNKVIIPTLDALFLRKLAPSKRKAIKKFLKVGGRGPVGCRIVNGHLICPSAGLKLAGQGLRLAGQGLKLAGQGRSLGAKRKTVAKRHRLIAKPLQFQDLGRFRMGLKGLGTKAGARKNPWLKHVAKYRKAHPGVSYKDALKRAKKTYKK